MKVERILVVGAGQMGSGIAQVAAQAGFQVYLYDQIPAALERGATGIVERLNRNVVKGKMTEVEKDQTLQQLQVINELAEGVNVDMVIEAVVERLDVKQALFQQLDQLLPAHAILASNTSSLPITQLAAVTGRPEQVVGMHFMNPVPVMRLVEVIRGLATVDATVTTVLQMAERMGKVAVEVNDYPGFISNRILMPMINEAIYAVYEGVSTVEAVDTIMKLGMNHPMGPLQLADFIGLDTCLYIMEILHEGFGDSKYRPCPLLRNYVAAGWLGRKTGRGFYVYQDEN
ncbi:3-hydroxybutyryl-CoA dehydrogenase [Rubeoparvulum massiliense]|uniref:3-hydroxybutyryl-CoA dehydrogenase n=1 Tax=Rubeoparvulum massiliense TaxID=1631346 RepID=UPI00065DEC9B|nr:3-hydroxybutyryl-CoA dehydrogenase [Rubeoparvulum massiliense]